MPDVEVRLPAALGRYVLPDPPEGEELVKAVRASVLMLDAAPDDVTLPLYASTWRAALGTADFSLHVAGPTGAGKTELVALAARHYGAGLDARNLPGSWTSTGNALEAMAHTLKDALFPVDDFAPNGSTADVQRYHRDADRLLRAQGNNAGRHRLAADASLKGAKPPRGLVVSTGEDAPRGQSVRGRVLIVDVAPGTVDFDRPASVRRPAYIGRLSLCQQDAAEGLYAGALAGLLRWLAPTYGDVRAGLPAEVAALRRQASLGTGHKRTPGIVADLAVGLRYFLRFAVDVGAFSPDKAAELWALAWAALGRAAAAQSAYQAASEPTGRFLVLLAAAIASERAHVADAKGSEPSESPERWGWRLRVFGAGDNARDEWQPLGDRVGWITDEGLLLEPVASFKAAQQMGAATGEPLSVGEQTLRMRMRERGLLVSTDDARGKLTVRRTLAGDRRAVLHLRPDALTAHEPAQSAQSAPVGAAPSWSPEPGGPIPRADRRNGAAKSAQETGPETSADQGQDGRSGPVGPVGPVPGTHDRSAVSTDRGAA